MAAKLCSADNFRCFEVKPLLTIREYVNLKLFDARVLVKDSQVICVSHHSTQFTVIVIANCQQIRHESHVTCHMSQVTLLVLRLA